jgi:L-asparaginase
LDKILFIQTGGTIDKDYPRSEKGWAFEISEPAAENILMKLNPSFEYEVISAMKKDSLEITLIDRQKLLKLIQKRKENKIIITHGSDTLIETGLYLEENIESKLIILTGSMRPAKFSNTDAEINLGLSMGALNVLKNGVHIAMSGLVLPANQTGRDKNTGKFIKLGI